MLLSGLLYDLTGTYDLAFFFSGGTAALAACVMFLVPICRIKQGMKRQSLLKTKEDKKSPQNEETQKLDSPTKVDICSKNDSGISLVIPDNTPQSSNSQSDTSLNKAGKEKLLSEYTDTHTMWNDGVHVEVVSSTLRRRQMMHESQEKMQFCSGFFPLALDEKELDDLLKKESEV